MFSAVALLVLRLGLRDLFDSKGFRFWLTVCSLGMLAMLACMTFLFNDWMLLLAAIFTAVAMGLAMGMGMLGVAVVFFLLSAAAVLMLTKLHFGAMPENAKALRITVPEDVDYETALPDVFRAHHVTATLEKVRTESMGTLFELTYQVNLPSAVPSKALLDDLRERNGNLPILFTNPGDKDSL